jgi:hypothetical protein
MTLDPAALITEAEQAAVLAILSTSNDKRTALVAAERNLDTFIRDRLTADVGMLLDLRGDGELKPVSQCARWVGRSPNSFAEKKREERESGSHPPETPPPAASAGVRAQALALWNNRQRATKRYYEAGHALNGRLNHLMRRHGCRTDRCCDVFGDGLERELVDCVWPEGAQLFRARLIR